MNVANKRDKKKCETKDSSLRTNFDLETRDQRFPGSVCLSLSLSLSLSRSVGRVEENPGNEVALQALLSSAPCSRVLASLAQIGELARRLEKN